MPAIQEKKPARGGSASGGKTLVSRDGTNIYYEIYRPAQDFPSGSGEPRRSPASALPTLFFVHGIGGDVDAWQFVRPFLSAQGYGAVAMDLRGHGHSDHPKHRAAHNIERIEEDIQAVMDAEHVRKPILIGHSGGAVVAAQFAAHHSDLLQKLILINGSYCPPSWLASPLLRGIANVVISVGGFISPPSYKKWHSPYPLGKTHKEFEIYGLARTMFYNSLRSYLYTSYELINIDLSAHLEKISIPTLLIASEHDGIFPVHIQQHMQKKIPNSKLIVLKDTNHVSVLNNPKGVAHAMLEFLRF